MKESTCQFGPAGHLSGILTTPGAGGGARTALVLVSAGLTGKSGPYRLYTEAARRLAVRGIATLRFDLGGIGNSEQVDFASPLPVRTHNDISQAVAFLLERVGPRRLLLGGLCSGAEDALRYAGRDARVNGVVMIDPHAFRTPGWWLHHLLSLRSLKGAAQTLLKDIGLPRALQSADDIAARESEGELINYRYMSRQEAGDLLSRLVGRGGRAHYIYTADRSEHFNHAGQLQRMFPTLEQSSPVTVDYLPQLEHTQFLREDRERLIGCIADWADDSIQPPQAFDEEETAAAVAGH